MKHMNSTKHWIDDGYTAFKNKCFTAIDNYLDVKPKKILDIGCGYAQESLLFQKKYGSKLWLLDGDASNSGTRDVSYGTAESMKFYNHIADLQKYFDAQNLEYVFVNALDPLINDDTKFDLIFSFLSCGFHYPLEEYFDLIKKHSYKNTRLIFTLRKGIKHNCKIINVISEHKKMEICEIEI